MDLQLALLISGIALIALVLVASLFPATGFKLKALLAKIKSREAPSASTRDNSVAPRLDADDAAILGEDALFDEEDSLYDVPLTNDAQFDPRSIASEPSATVDQEEPIEQAVVEEEYISIPDVETRPDFQEVVYQRHQNAEPIVESTNQTEEEVVELASSGSNLESNSESELASEVDQSATAQEKQTESEGPEMQITPTEKFTSLKQIDYWVKLISDSSHSLADVRSKFTTLADSSNLNQSVHVLNLQDKQWHDLDSLANDATFEELVISLQLLVDGQPLTSSQLSHFVGCVDTLAEGLGAQTQYLAPPSEAAIQSTNLASLYANCQGVIEASVISPDGQSFYGKLIESSAKMQGLDYLDGGYARIKRMANRQVVLYRLVSTEGMTFSEDMSAETKLSAVKFVMHPAGLEYPGRVAKEMLDSAKAFASRVKGELSIIDGVEYHQDQLRQVRDQVSKIEAKMEQVGIPAGSAEANRLFS